MEKEEGEALLDEAFEMSRKYEKLFSKTVKGSDIDRLNKSNGKFVELDEETVKLIKKSIELGELSKGKFDISVGRLTELWDFKSSNPKVPEEAKVKEAIKTVNYRDIEVQGNKVRLKNPQAKLDLGGIAKGYIGDKVTTFLIDNGVESGIVNLGGNALAIGRKKDGTSFRIGIEKPYSKRQEMVAVVEVSNETIVTSGIYERMFESKGKKYHHVLDPKTGFPVENNIVSVSVKTKIGESYIADGLSTSFLLMGEEKALRTADALDGIEIMIVMKDGAVFQTDGFGGELR